MAKKLSKIPIQFPTPAERPQRDGRPDHLADLVSVLRRGSGQTPRVGLLSYGSRPSNPTKPVWASMALSTLAVTKVDQLPSRDPAIQKITWTFLIIA